MKPRSNPLRVWAPLESRVRIEYSPDFLRDLAGDVSRSHDEADEVGLLYGWRCGGTIRVIATDPRDDLEIVGVFSARVRGDVFLTEDDVARFEDLENPEAIALVVAGDNAGFFVREPDGAMQTIKSYEEFPIIRVSKRPQPPLRRWIPAAAAAILTVALFALPTRPLEVQSESGALRIRFHRGAFADGARVQIVDGSERRSIPITRTLTSIVYTPVTRDVRITVTR